MRTNIIWEKEPIDEWSWRVKVMGGWIVYTEHTSGKGHIALTSQFIKDTYHEWSIQQAKEKEPVIEWPIEAPTMTQVKR